MTNVGLFFGSFNPVHIGHITIAGYFLEYTKLEQIWFVVSPQNPLKTKDTLLPGHHRLYLAELALGNSEKMIVSDIEFKLPIPSYTIDTLTRLEERHPSYSFSLIMGEDNLYTLTKWKNAPELIKRCNFYIYPRPGNFKMMSPDLEKLLEGAVIHRVDAPLMGISGTMIRKGIKEGRDMSFLIPKAAWRYIKDMHFYE